MKIIEEVYYGNCYQRDDFGIEHGEHWIDIGAHIGCFSKKVLCNGATVDSYEPSPDSYELLIRNCGQGYNVAVAHNAGMATLIPGSRHYFDRIIPDNAGKIPVVAFNEIVKPGDCVKMDIEGGEMDILDNSDFTGIKKMVIAYHTNRDNRTDNLLKRIARLEQFFARVRHQPIKGEKINMFPNELFIYCDQKSLIKPKIIRKF
jgi:FkbM family methyltransferase